LTPGEATLLTDVAAIFVAGLADVYVSMPHSNFRFLKLTNNLQDLQFIT
jgi:hypothetical protein